MNLGYSRLLLASAAAALVAGCAGKKVEHPTPTSESIQPEFAPFGLSYPQSQCLLAGLQTRLSERQLGRLARAAGKVRQASTNSAQLNPQELLGSARLLRDEKISTGLNEAALACGIAGASVASVAPTKKPPRPATTEAPPSTAGGPRGNYAVPSPSASAVWLNLGAAPTGQAIAIDAASVQDTPGRREAWFRITNPGDSGPTGTSYRLRIDCTGRTINPMALRKVGSEGAVSEEKDYGPDGEGALAVEGGTVMEIAFLALCT